MSELTEFEEARLRRRRKKNWRRTKKLAIVLAVVAVIGITVFAGGILFDNPAIVFLSEDV